MINPILKVNILSSTPSSKPIIGIKENVNSVSGSGEYYESSTPTQSAIGEAFQSVERERRKGHQMISTAIYYQAERRGFEYGYEEAHADEADGETGDA